MRGTSGAGTARPGDMTTRVPWSGDLRPCLDRPAPGNLVIRTFRCSRRPGLTAGAMLCRWRPRS